jgi:hypothetical protein
MKAKNYRVQVTQSSSEEQEVVFQVEFIKNTSIRSSNGYTYLSLMGMERNISQRGDSTVGHNFLLGKQLN